jgi:hypothetical protein
VCAVGGRVCLGNFNANGLNVNDDNDDDDNSNVGWSVARSLGTSISFFYFRLLIHPPIMRPISSRCS